jgi:prepilin-type N-terminal cleavage/methylation domain-containing protein
MKTPRWPSPRAGGFTLVELLVVVVIVLLVSAVALPVVLPALSHRQVSESARILQAALVGARDAAIRAHEPRGLRFLPDPVLTVPPLASAIAVTTSGNPIVPGSNAGSVMLAYNRFVPIEPAGDYSSGRINVTGGLNALSIPLIGALTGFPPLYPWNNPGADPTIYYPCFPGGQVLMVEEAVFQNNTPPIRNEPVSWFWNIRVGDKIRLSDSGRFYTVVGPMNITPTRSDPQTDPTGLLRNPEMFVNVGPPGTPSPLLRSYGLPSPVPVEFLFLVNGEDDNNNGLVDEGFNGIDDNIIAETTTGSPATIDEVAPNSEWETEKWVGTRRGDTDQPYVIARRPVPTQGAREVSLPPGVVIDATSWNVNPERSRLPIDPNSLYVDIMVNPSGEVIPTTIYSTPVIPGLSGLQTSFFHFWLAERQDVHELTEMWGATAGVPNQNPNKNTTNPLINQSYLLPMPLNTPHYMPLSPTLVLKGDRRLVTLFTRTGLITSDTIEQFDGDNINRPFQDAQLGLREAK